jgi:hypothetical protein
LDWVVLCLARIAFSKFYLHVSFFWVILRRPVAPHVRKVTGWEVDWWVDRLYRGAKLLRTFWVCCC